MRWALGAAVALLATASVVGVALVLAPSGHGGSSIVVAMHGKAPGDCFPTRLLRINAVTLTPKGGPNLTFTGYFKEPVRSPDGKTVALSGETGTILLVDVGTMRQVGSIRIGTRYDSTDVVSWPAADRLIVRSFQADAHRIGLDKLVVVDPILRRVIRELRFDQWWLEGGSRTDQGRVAVLITSSVRFTHPRLVVVEVDGRIRTVTLARMQAGIGYSGAAELGRFPGFAVDSARERAFVVDEGESVAIVDLRTLQIRYRKVSGLASPPRELAGPAHPTGTANPQRGPFRTATWLGAGLIAISGFDGYTGQAGRWLGESDAPAGLQLLDTRTWRVRTLDRRPQSFEWLGGRLIAYARSWDPRAGRVRGDALVAFDATGKLVYRIPGKGYWRTFNGRVYVDVARSSLDRVLDARTGRSIGRVPAARVDAVTGSYC